MLIQKDNSELNGYKQTLLSLRYRCLNIKIWIKLVTTWY